MASTPEHTLTAVDFYRLPDDENRHELVRGHIVREPNVGARHGRLVTRIAFLLETWVRDARTGLILTGDVGFLLTRHPDTVRAPDVAFVSHARYPVPDTEHAPFPGPPDLAVEVLSPSDRPGQVRAKVRDYLDAGAMLVWVVDPKEQVVHAFRTEPDSAEIFTLADTLTATDVLPGFAAPVAEIFSF